MASKNMMNHYQWSGLGAAVSLLKILTNQIITPTSGVSGTPFGFPTVPFLPSKVQLTPALDVMVLF